MKMSERVLFEGYHYVKESELHASWCHHPRTLRRVCQERLSVREGHTMVTMLTQYGGVDATISHFTNDLTHDLSGVTAIILM